MLGAASSFARRLLAWYDRCRRDLPWRPCDRTGRRPGPYHVLVSEAMLQQTQVATVIPYYHRFVERFPTVADLAAADEQDVLRLWQGLGYYSRARNLRAAARAVVAEHGGEVPRGVEGLLALPGVGRYTAGAVASIAFGTRAPIVDGNVARVLCRLDRIELDPRGRAGQDLLWRRATEVLPKTRVGDFNSALMELGATVCTPRAPQCLTCPVREHCAARAAGVQEQIPAPRKARPTPLLRRATFCIRRPGTDEWLIEQRPPRGRWAGMWQFVTVDAEDGASPARAAAAAAAAVALLPVPVSAAPPPRKLGVVTHGLTHRRYEFDVYACESAGDGGAAGAAGAGETAGAPGAPPRRWSTLAGLAAYPMPRPHVKIAAMLAAP
jgi:A/G-specific adenine glycosylase